MARLPYASLATKSKQVRDRAGEDPPNVTLMLAHASEPVYLAYSELLINLMTKSSLDPKLRELAILRVGYLSASAYELFQHEPFGRFVGLTGEQLAVIKAGDVNSDLLDEAQSAVLEFVDDVVANVRASDATLNRVRQFLGDTDVVDLTLLIGQYMAVCRFLETTGVDLDGAAVDWDEFTAES